MFLFCRHNHHSSSTSPSVTRVLLQDSICKYGHISWHSPHSSSPQLIQFHKNHDSFTVCLQSNTSLRELTINQLKGRSQKQIVVRTDNKNGDLNCITSHCNHVSLLLKTTSISNIDISYNVIQNQRKLI